MQFFNQTGIAAIPELGIVLGIMVLVHEFGHFAVAKLCGVRVEHFAIGFGKRLFGFVHNGTDYRVNLIPLGGYVKMAGVGDEPISSAGDGPAVASNDPGELQNHPRWQRALITLAGPIANFILAFVLMLGLYATHNEVPAYFNQVVTADYISPNSPIAKTGMQIGDTLVQFDKWHNPTWDQLFLYAQPDINKTEDFTYLHNGTPVPAKISVDYKGEPADFDFMKLGIVPLEQQAPLQVASLTAQDSPAARAGLQPNDRVLAIDGLHPHSVQALLAYLHDRAGKPALLTLQRNDAQGRPATIQTTVQPVMMDTLEGKDYRLGFVNVLPPTHLQRMPLPRAARQAAGFCVTNSKLIFLVLQRLFTREVSVKSLSSPIGIGVQVHQAFQMEGWSPIIGTMAMISLNLGIFNLLPIPILDGGMMVFLFVESILRRDVNQQLKERIYQVAFVCILLFAAIVIFNDLTRIIPHAHT